MAFPWRFLLPASFTLSLLAGLASGVVEKRFPRYGVLFTVLALAALVVPHLSYAAPEKYFSAPDKDLTPSLIASRRLKVSMLDEYLPRWALKRPLYSFNEVAVLQGQARTEIELRSPETIRFRVNAPFVSTLKLNEHFFPGWKIRVDGTDTRFIITEPDGKIQFDVSPGEHIVEARLTLTDWQKDARTFSLASLLAIVLFSVGRRAATLRNRKRFW
jgi:hypothetical protein